jgi:hypothetical protein
VDKSGPLIDEDVTIAFADPSDTRSPHLKAIAAAAEKRHYRLLHQLKGAMASMFASSGIELERAFRGFDENGDGQLDYGEFSRGLKNLGVALGEQQLEDLVTILDRDGDGTSNVKPQTKSSQTRGTVPCKARSALKLLPQRTRPLSKPHTSSGNRLRPRLRVCRRSWQRKARHTRQSWRRRLRNTMPANQSWQRRRQREQSWRQLRRKRRH